MKTRMLGAATIAFAIAFNIPYSLLAQSFDYPDVLRRPAGEVLQLFAAGGPALIWTWYAFALAALAFVPLSVALSITRDRMVRVPALALGAALTGALAGLVQAIGLMRWVFVVPELARNGGEVAQSQFALMNSFAGVAIGEHLGYLLTAGFVILVAAFQLGERKPISGLTGLAASGLIVIGAGEGLAIALGGSGAIFSVAAIGGYLLLTVWLILTGIGLMRQPAQPAREVYI